jgi:outer membrane immunogenic protein
MMRAAIAGGLVLALGTAAYSADMPIKAAPIYVPPPITWTGPYVGGNLGGGWFNPGGSVDVPSIPIAPPPCKHYCKSPDPLFGLSGGSGAGFIGGVQAGYTYQFLPRWIVGIEGDFEGSTLSSDQSTAPLTLPGSSASMSQNVDWLASIRGRVGYLWTPTILLYGTGGAAWADVNYSGSATVQASPSVTAATSFSSAIGLGCGRGRGIYVVVAMAAACRISVLQLQRDYSISAAVAQRRSAGRVRMGSLGNFRDPHRGKLSILDASTS